MKKAIRFIVDTFLNKRLDLRVQLFNVLAMAGMLVSVVSAVVSLAMGENPRNAGTYIIYCLISAALLWFSCQSGRYQLCYMISIVVVFIIGFPLFFFNNGGYYGTIPYFFIFAIVFTVFMLEGKKAFLFAGLEMAVYVGICLYAYFFFTPDSYYTSSRTVMITCIFGFAVVGIALGVTMFYQFKLYNQQQRTLAEQNAALEQLNRLKTEFLGNVSHELKTPLTVMSVSAQNTRRDLSELPELEAVSGQMKLIAAEADRLGLMVGQILDMTRIEEGRMACELRECYIDEIIQTTISTYYPLLKKNNNRLIVQPNDHLPTVRADEGRISQVLVNLLQNAIRHTQSGEITVCALQDGNFVRTIVSDTGEGIEPERLPLIFERFESHDSKKNRSGNDTGTGLGLYICKHIVENHGGEIGITSTVGKGTNVSFTIPVHPQAL